MLIEINLAPGSTAGGAVGRRLPSVTLPSMPKLSGDVRVVGGVAAGLGVVALLVFGYWTMGQTMADLDARIQSEVTDSIRYAGAIELVTALQARQDTVRQKIDVIRSVDTRRYVWPHLLDEISLALPAYTWLTEIRTTAPADSLARGPAFAIQGNAGSTQALTRFMKNLEESSFIGEVTLVTSEQEVLEGRTIQRFTLEASYHDPPPGAIETIPLIVSEGNLPAAVPE